MLTHSFAGFVFGLHLFQVLEKDVGCEMVKNHSYLDLLKSPQLRKITLCSGYFWYQTFLWYGTFECVVTDCVALLPGLQLPSYTMGSASKSQALASISISHNSFMVLLKFLPKSQLSLSYSGLVGGTAKQCFWSQPVFSLESTRPYLLVYLLLLQTYCMFNSVQFNFLYSISYHQMVSRHFDLKIFPGDRYFQLSHFSEHSVVRTCIAVIAKFFSEAAFTTAFLYTSELFPTVLR